VANSTTLVSEGDLLVFTTPRWVRVESFLFVVFVGGASFLISLAAAGAAFAVTWLLGAPWVLAAAFALFTWLVMLRLVWNISVAPLRFCIAVGSDVAEMGSGWLKCSFEYGDVEGISLPEKRGRRGVGLEGGGKGAFVYLSPADETACAAILRQRCANALFSDHRGTLHLPGCADRPLLTLNTLYRRYRSRATGSLLLALFAGTIAIGKLGRVCDHFFGHGMKLTLPEIAMEGVGFVATAITAVAGASYALRNRRRAGIVRMRLTVAQHEEKNE
jgi:hypothetical protein